MINGTKEFLYTCIIQTNLKTNWRSLKHNKEINNMELESFLNDIEVRNIGKFKKQQMIIRIIPSFIFDVVLPRINVNESLNMQSIVKQFEIHKNRKTFKSDYRLLSTSFHIRCNS